MTRAFLDHPVPFGIAHRGGAEEWPENTMPAFEAAIALGYRHVETDAHLSEDGMVFAFHDAILDRLTDRAGPIGALAAEVVLGADAAFHFSRDGRQRPLRGGGIRVPTMEELLTTWPEVFVNIDVKSDAVVGPLIVLLRRLDAFDRVCIGSFSDERLRRVRTLAGGGLCTSMGPRAVTGAWLGSRVGRMARRGADCLQVPVRVRLRLLDRRFLEAAHRAGLQVHAWTINREQDMRELLDLGVDAIMTDRPTMLRSVLTERGLWPHSGARRVAGGN